MLADSHLWFLAVNVGAYGSHVDGRIFRDSCFGRQLQPESLMIPSKRPLPGTTEPRLPLIKLADEAFGLAENMMRPYGGPGLSHKQKVFNYHLSLTHRVVECVFGIFTAKLRVLL